MSIFKPLRRSFITFMKTRAERAKVYHFCSLMAIPTAATSNLPGTFITIIYKLEQLYACAYYIISDSRNGIKYSSSTKGILHAAPIRLLLLLLQRCSKIYFLKKMGFK